MAINSKIIKGIVLSQSRGSLMALSFGFYLLAMTLAFISINVASAYNIKKELTNIAEGAINKSAQSINILAYYAELNRFNSNKQVPIDCVVANIKFHNLIANARLSDKQILVEDFNCSLYEVWAQVSITGKLPVDLTFLHLDQLNTLTIRSKVGASSVYMPN